MAGYRHLMIVVVVGWAALTASDVIAQRPSTRTRTPLRNSSSSFRENFGFRLFGGRNNPMIRFSASQGSRRGHSSVSPSVTTLNGYPGYFSEGSLRPFVTGVVPVVGGRRGGGGYRNVLEERLSRLRAQDAGTSKKPPDSSSGAARSKSLSAAKGDGRFESRLGEASASSAGQAAESLAEIRRRQSGANDGKQQAALDYFRQGRQAESAGKLGVAKYYYKMALRRAQGPLKKTLTTRLTALQQRSSSSRAGKRK